MSSTDQHALTLEPQPIADQWMAKCSCGWHSTASFYDFPNRDALLEELRKRFKQHVEAPVIN